MHSVEFVYDPLFSKCFVWTYFYQSWPQTIIPKSCFPELGPVWTQLNFDAGTSFLMTSPYPANSRRWRASRRLQFQGEKNWRSFIFFSDEAEIETKSRRNFFSQIRMEAIFFRKWNLERSIFGGKLKKMSTHRRRDKTNKTEWMFPKPRHFPENETVHSLPISSSSPFFFVGTGFEPVFRELSPILRCNFWICRNGTNVSKIFCPWFLAT